MTEEVLAESFRAGQLEASEVFTLRHTIYFPNEIALLLGRAGFARVTLRNDHPKTAFGPEGCVFTLIGER